jgi:hypothetical protein
MIRRVCVLLVCGVVLTGVVTGCGGGGGPATKASSTPAPTATSTATVPLAVKIREAIVACRKQVTKLSDIPASEKPVAEADCNGIKTGNISSLRVILKQACLNRVATLPAADQPPATLACKKVY